MCHEFFKHQAKKSNTEKNKRKPAMMMLTIAMIQGIATDNKGENDHTRLESLVFYDINAK